jgi:hypothetical protein
VVWPVVRQGLQGKYSAALLWPHRNAVGYGASQQLFQKRALTSFLLKTFRFVPPGRRIVLELIIEGIEILLVNIGKHDQVY